MERGAQRQFKQQCQNASVGAAPRGSPESGGGCAAAIGAAPRQIRGSLAGSAGLPAGLPRWLRRSHRPIQGCLGGSPEGREKFDAGLPRVQRGAAPNSTRGCPDGSAGQPRIRRGAASNSGEAAGGAAPNLTRGCPDGSAELPAGQPRMAAGLPRSHTAPLPRRRVILGTQGGQRNKNLLVGEFLFRTVFLPRREWSHLHQLGSLT